MNKNKIFYMFLFGIVSLFLFHLDAYALEYNSISNTSFNKDNNLKILLIDDKEDKSSTKDEDYGAGIQFDPIEVNDCSKVDPQLTSSLGTGLGIVKILVPALLMIFGGFDFAQAVFAADENGIKKAQSKFIKRLIIAVVIFFIPGLLKIIMEILGGVWGNIDPTLCGVL